MENFRELILMSEVVAKEKGISPEVVIDYLAEGIEVALKKTLPEGANVLVDINVENHEINAWRLFKLVNQIESVESEMLFSEVEDEIVHDGQVWEPMEVHLTRQQLNIMRQAAFQKINTKSRNVHIQDLLEKQFKLYTGTLKLNKKDSYIIDLMGTDIVLPKKFISSKETLKLGQKITFTLEYDEDKKQYFATQTSPQFLIELFKKEIVQIEEGEIEIVNCVRSPGFKSKVIVKTKNNKYDPARMCVGRNGVHVKNIQAFLGDENIDVINYEPDTANMLIKLLSPINVSKIILDEDKQIAEVAVSDDDISKAIGKSGKNIELISRTLGWKIFIYSNTQWDNKELLQNKAYAQSLIKALDCDLELAEYLVSQGYTSVDQVAYIPVQELELDELDLDTLTALQENALETVKNVNLMDSIKNTESLYLLGFNLETIEKLNSHQIFNKNDIADLASDELQEILPEIDIEKAGSIIMEARKQ